MEQRLTDLGYGVLLLDAAATPNGAVENPQDGEIYARFLRENRDKYDGVILCLPNFGDETGVIAALQDAGVPILIQAYPDELDKMGFSQRRDAFCGKFSIMDVFYQYELPYTTFKPHTIHPSDNGFARHLEWFAGVCRVTNGMKRMTVGAIGARTTAFKTIRFDELTLQHCGITTETLDLSDVFQRVRELDTDTNVFEEKTERLKGYTRWDTVPKESFHTLIRLSVVLDEIIAEYKMDALALRCWLAGNGKRTEGIPLCSSQRAERSRFPGGLRTGCMQCRGHARALARVRQIPHLSGLEQQLW